MDRIRIYDIAQQFFRANYGEQIKGKAYSFEDTTGFFTVNVKGQSGLVQLIDNDTAKYPNGDASFNKTHLIKGNYYVIDSIRALFDKTAATVGACTYEDAPPAALLNAVLLVRLDQEILAKIPVTELFNLSLGNAVSNDDYYRQLPHFPIIEDDKNFSFELQYPKGVTVPVDSEKFLRIEFRMHEVYVK